MLPTNAPAFVARARRTGVLCAAALLVAASASAQLTWSNLTLATEPPVENPFKGFMDYADPTVPARSTEFPHTLEFFYIGMDEFWVDYEDDVPDQGWQIDLAALEVELAAIASRGRQAVFRIYVDEPREQTTCPTMAPAATVDDTALPDFLMSDVALTYYCSGGWEGWSPDYPDADFLDAVDDLLADLVAAYDGDPRIAFVQVGLLGHWGEWHTFFDGNDPLDCDEATDGVVHDAMNAVLDTFDGFHSTLALVSADVLQCAQRPAGGSAADPGVSWFDRSIGLHDDDFANSTVCETYGFDSRAQSWGAENDWLALPVGGEIQPSLQGPIHDDDDGLDCDPPDTDGYDTGELDSAVEATHPSFLLNFDLFDSVVVDPRLANAEATARRMGYQYFVPAVALPDETRVDEPLMLTVRVENLGVAPIYYALAVELVVLDGAVEVATFPTDIYLEDVYDAPARGVDAIDFDVEIADHGLRHGSYQLALRVPNPMAGGAALRFANAEQSGDLLILGPVTIDEDPIFLDDFETGNTTNWN